MDKWTTIGHRYIKQVLDSQMRTRQLAHAYLFQGPKGVGKSVLAEEFVKKISVSRSDRLFIDIAVNGSVAEIREFLKLASLTSAQGGTKTVVISNFEQASVSVSNTLLKTLEEPSAQTIFILLTNGYKVLPTIQSRCVTLRFGTLSDAEMELYAQQNQWQITASALQFASGIPQQLRDYLSGDESAAEMASLLKKLEEVGKQVTAKKMVFVQDLSDYDNNFLSELLKNWVHVLRYQLKDSIQLYKAIQVALETIKRLSMNANKKMTLEYFLLNTQL